jgi:hypothetical protein
LLRNPVQQLYRTISKEVPRVLTIYDADISPDEVGPDVNCSDPIEPLLSG